jgi:phospholipid/cholesterol/gamma-HCH transport system substrate-binding protein
MPPETGREVRVGTLLLAAIAVLAVGVFFIGRESNLFVPKNRYFIRFTTVGGLKAGNPVQLNGVDVGKVKKVILPREIDQSAIQVWIAIDERYADRVREDSQARIKTLGLLGDKYVDLVSGSPGSPVVPNEGEIPAAPMTSVDELLASGEDTMDNIVAISSSLKNVLARMEAGEGLLGQLTSNTERGEQFSKSVVATMESVRRMSEKMENGSGPLARLINDKEMADRLDQALTRLDAVLAEVQEGDGLLPHLLNDAGTRQRFDDTLANLGRASGDLARFAQKVANSQGLMQKLLTDEPYAKDVGENLRRLIERLNLLSEKLTGGDGTAAKLINDPSVYDAVKDILVGVDESRLLRWLIRNRQKAGIEKRYDDTKQQLEQQPAKLPEQPAAPSAQPAPPESPAPDGTAAPHDPPLQPPAESAPPAPAG